MVRVSTSSRDDLAESLRERGLRVTPQRRAILAAFSAGENGHVTADDVFERAVAGLPELSRATVYNTLDLLESLGEVLVLDFGQGYKRYDGRCPAPHAHLVCAACGRVDDVDGVDLANLPVQVADRTGYRVLEHRFDLRGLCPACQAAGFDL